MVTGLGNGSRRQDKNDEVRTRAKVDIDIIETNRMIQRFFKQMATTTFTHILCLGAVSYTHLDVYKRQH